MSLPTSEEARDRGCIFGALLYLIENAISNESLNHALSQFQEAYKLGELTPDQTRLLVAAGQKRRSELNSAAEESKKNPARQALQKAKYQGVGGVPRPNPHLMKGDEHKLYNSIVTLAPELPDAFAALEKLELWYMEKERSEYGKKWLVSATEEKLAEITTAWAKKNQAPK